MLPRLLQLLGAAKPVWEVPVLLAAWLRHQPSMRQFLCNKAMVDSLQSLFEQPSTPPPEAMVRTCGLSSDLAFQA